MQLYYTTLSQKIQHDSKIFHFYVNSFSKDTYYQNHWVPLLLAAPNLHYIMYQAICCINNIIILLIIPSQHCGVSLVGEEREEDADGKDAAPGRRGE